MKVKIWRVEFEDGAEFDVSASIYGEAIKKARARALKEEYPESELKDSKVIKVHLIAEED